MSPDRVIKMLLMQLNKKGKEASLTKTLRYSETFGSISTYYKLTFWKRVPTEKKDDSNNIIYKNIADNHEFKSVNDLINYMSMEVK